MPYRTEGGVKFTDHHLQSPLLNIANSCAVCHRWSEDGDSPPRGRHPGQGPRGPRLGGEHDRPGPFRHRRREASRARATTNWPACASWCVMPNCVGTTWRPTTAWASTRRRSASGFWPPRSIWPANAASSAPGFSPSTASAEPVEYPDFSTKEKAQSLIKPFVDGKPPKLL